MNTPILDITATCRHFIQQGTAPATLQHVRLQSGPEPTGTMDLNLQHVLCGRMESGKNYRILIEEIAD